MSPPSAAVMQIRSGFIPGRSSVKRDAPGARAWLDVPPPALTQGRQGLELGGGAFTASPGIGVVLGVRVLGSGGSGLGAGL